MVSITPQRIVCILFLIFFLSVSISAQAGNRIRIYAQDWVVVGDVAVIWDRDGSLVAYKKQIKDDYVIWSQNYDIKAYYGESLVYNSHPFSSAGERGNFILEILDVNKNVIKNLSLPANSNEFIEVYTFDSAGYVRFPKDVVAWEYNQLFISNLNEDNEPPIFSSISPVSGVFLEYKKESLEILFEAVDSNTLVNYFVNDTKFSISDFGLLVNKSILEVGDYCVLITAQDLNYNSASITFCFSVVDTISPVIEAIEDVYLIEGNLFEKQIFAFDFSPLFYFVNDSDFEISNTGFLKNSSILEVQNYSLEIKVVDSSSNSAFGFFSLFILENISLPDSNETNGDNETNVSDSIPPYLEVVSPIFNFEYNSSFVPILVNVSDENLDSVWFFDGLSSFIINPNETYYFNLSDGNYTFTFYANDTFGNFAFEFVSFSVNSTLVPSIPENGANESLIIKCRDCDSKKTSSTIFQRLLNGEDLSISNLDFDSGFIPLTLPLFLKEDGSKSFLEESTFSYFGFLLFFILFVLLMMLLILMRILKR